MKIFFRSLIIVAVVCTIDQYIVSTDPHDAKRIHVDTHATELASATLNINAMSTAELAQYVADLYSAPRQAELAELREQIPQTRFTRERLAVIENQTIAVYRRLINTLYPELFSNNTCARVLRKDPEMLEILNNLQPTTTLESFKIAVANNLTLLLSAAFSRPFVPMLTEMRENIEPNFSISDNNTYLCITYNTQLMLFNIPEHRRIRALTHNRPITHALFSPGSRYLFVTGRTGESVIIDAATGNQLHTVEPVRVKGHLGGAIGVQWVNPTTIYIMYSNGIVASFDAAAGIRSTILATSIHGERLSNFDIAYFSPNGQYILATLKTGVQSTYLINTINGHTQFAHTEDDSVVDFAVFSPDSRKFLAALTNNNTLTGFISENGNLILYANTETRNTIDKIFFSPDSNHACVISYRLQNQHLVGWVSTSSFIRDNVIPQANLSIPTRIGDGIFLNNEQFLLITREGTLMRVALPIPPNRHFTTISTAHLANAAPGHYTINIFRKQQLQYVAAQRPNGIVETTLVDFPLLVDQATNHLNIEPACRVLHPNLARQYPPAP